MAVSKTKTGVDPELMAELLRTGKLKVHDKPYSEVLAGRARTGKQLKETPAYLLPDDHFRKRKRTNITLSAKAKAIAKKIGKGVASRGIERALLHYSECPRADGRKRNER